jgi:DNA-binding transcriptional regulator YiaG
MSDIYLELRTRIPVVAARTRLGTARIQEAQDATGLSNEAIARAIPISEKTWRRWKEAGEIPTAALPAVAKVLNLELLEASPMPVHVGRDGDRPDELSQRLDAIEDALAQILTRLES